MRECYEFLKKEAWWSCARWTAEPQSSRSQEKTVDSRLLQLLPQEIKLGSNFVPCYIVVPQKMLKVDSRVGWPDSF